VLVAASALHVAEEHALGWQGWAAEWLGERIGIKPTWMNFWPTKGFLIVYGIAAAAFGWRARAFALSLPAVLLNDRREAAGIGPARGEDDAEHGRAGLEHSVVAGRDVRSDRDREVASVIVRPTDVAILPDPRHLRGRQHPGLRRTEHREDGSAKARVR
jgi:hypothetical protein